MAWCQFLCLQFLDPFLTQILRFHFSGSLQLLQFTLLLIFIRMARFELPQCLLPACREQLFSGMAPPASPTPAESAHHVFMEMLHFCLGL